MKNQPAQISGAAKSDLVAPPPILTASQKRWSLFGVGLGVLSASLDAGIINVALPTLVQALHSDFPKAQWAILGYHLVRSGFVLGATRLGDLWSKKLLFLGGVVLFTISSLLCGFAPSMEALIGFRVLQGMGAVLITGLGLAMITEVFPDAERGRAIGAFGSMFSLGITLGPSVGGVLVGWLGWRSIFWVNVPLGMLASLLVFRVVPPSIRSERRESFDVIGALLALLTMGSFALGMTQGQRQGFTSSSAIALLVFAAIACLSFLVLESRLEHPLLKLSLFRQLPLSLGLLSGWLAFIVLAGTTFIIPFFLERGMHYPPAKVGLLLAVLSVASALISPIAGTLCDRFGTPWVSLIGLSLMLAGCLAMSNFNGHQTELEYGLYLFLLGTGVGMFRASNESSVMGAVPRDRLGMASGLLALTRASSIMVGISLMGAIFATVSARVAPGTDINIAPTVAIAAGFQSTFHLAALLIGAAAIATVTEIYKSAQS